MPFCATCGAQVEGRFCAKCGSPVEVAAGAPPTAGVAGPGAAYAGPAAPAAATAGMNESTASGLAYLIGLITGILFLVLEPYSKNRAVRFHAFQSIFLNVAFIGVSIVFGIVLSILSAIAGAFLFLGVLWPVMYLAFLGIWLYVMIMAFQGKKVVLPVIGPLAEKQAG